MKKEAENKTKDVAVKKSKSVKSALILVLICFIVAVGAFCFSRYCLVVYPISGISMENTLHDEDYILLFKTERVDYGDVIVFYSPEMDKCLVKRVIGKEGDLMQVKYSQDDSCYYIYRNGTRLDEEYIKEPITDNYYEMEETVPSGKVFVLGDNRNNSNDSHYAGFFADKNEIRGVGIIKYKSWKDVKFL